MNSLASNAQITSASSLLHQANAALEDALAAASASADQTAVSAIISAQLQLQTQIAKNLQEQSSAMEAAAAAGFTAFPNHPEQIKSRSELENEIKSLRNSLKIANESKSERSENHEQVKNQLDNLSRQLTESNDQLANAGGPFWFRRFHTSISIASAAAFLAVGNKLFTPGIEDQILRYSFFPVTLFGAALIVSGCIPAAFFFKKNKTGWALAIIASALFVAAVVACTIGIYLAAGVGSLFK
ncbi:hypothetical protein [Brevundimonas naejangsanensis]|uniref:hypothetical protein n=1 Tax=Brevundimonas naejangsanensis TaxID=588932 RepID=UPI00119CB82A|nr:hypothetical protein [Brevundimonas naejangsanensis]